MSRFTIVVAGCGGMSQKWVSYALERDDAQIAALVDISEANARKLAGQFELTCPIFTDLTEAIHSSGANLVFDVTIPDSHFQVAATAMRNGCDVMGEKPMAASMDQAAGLLACSEETGRSHAVMQNRRYDANIRALKQLVLNGSIGQIGYIGVDFFLGPHFGGFRESMESPLIVDMAIHTFDQARFICGADPVSVYCHEFNPPGSWYQGNASAVCIFEMSNGSVFCYRGSWCSEGAPTSWEGEWRITGSKGTAMWNGKDLPYAELSIPPDGHPFMHEVKRIEGVADWVGRSGHFGCLDEMFQALVEGRRAETDATDNRKSLAMVYGALESARTGCKVILS